MIKKNVKWGVSENVTVVEFGTGDIIVADGFISEDYTGCMLLANDVSGEIGRDHPEIIGKSTDNLKQDIIITFTNTESIDVVINCLKRIKNSLTPQKQTNEV